MTRTGSHVQWGATSPSTGGLLVASHGSIRSTEGQRRRRLRRHPSGGPPAWPLHHRPPCKHLLARAFFYHVLHALFAFHPILIICIPAIFGPRQLQSRRLFRRTIFMLTLLEKCICSTSLFSVVVFSTVFLRHTWLADRYRQIFYMR